MGNPGIEITKLEHGHEVHALAHFMANSEPWKTLRRTYQDGTHILADPEREVYVAYVQDEIVGFTILQMKGAFVGYIQTVGVLPDWRNRGIGSRLIAFAEARIFREAPNAFICASSFNPEAQRLYERLGFEVVGELSAYIVADHAEILMRKTIAPLTEFSAPAP